MYRIRTSGYRMNYIIQHLQKQIQLANANSKKSAFMRCIFVANPESLNSLAAFAAANADDFAVSRF